MRLTEIDSRRASFYLRLIKRPIFDWIEHATNVSRHLLLVEPASINKPTGAMIPGGVSAETSVGGVGGGLASTTKPGDPLLRRRRGFDS